MALMNEQEEIFVSGEERFHKSTDRNRCTIAGASGKIMLSVPLIGGRGVKSKTKDVRINYSEPWQKHHWKSIQSCYGKSSFFHFYEDRFRPFYEKPFEFLVDFNTQLLQVCFEILQWDKGINCRGRPGLKAKSQNLDLQPYHQVFEERHGFIPDLSIVDLIFNMGNEAPRYLK